MGGSSVLKVEVVPKAYHLLGRQGGWPGERFYLVTNLTPGTGVVKVKGQKLLGGTYPSLGKRLPHQVGTPLVLWPSSTVLPGDIPTVVSVLT